ncbi:MAG: hypothetical protein WCI18_04345 [Pseudomonadota bacterium]
MGLRIIKANSSENIDRLRALRNIQIEEELKRWSAVTARPRDQKSIARLLDHDFHDEDSEALSHRLKNQIFAEQPRVEFIQGNLDLDNISKLLED